MEPAPQESPISQVALMSATLWLRASGLTEKRFTVVNDGEPDTILVVTLTEGQ